MWKHCINVAAILMLGWIGGSFALITSEAAASELVDNDNQLQALHETSQQMYEQAKANEWAEAREQMKQIRALLPQLDYDGLTGIEGMNALAEATLSAEQTLNRVRLSESEAMAAVGRLRLATDALTHSNQPMWLQYYKWFEQDVNQMQQALDDQSFMEEQQKLIKQLQLHYYMVKPAMLISRKTNLVHQFDSILNYLHEASAKSQLTTESMSGLMPQMKLTIDQMFGKESKDAYTGQDYQPVPLSSVIALALVIIAVLSVAAWRIYRYERKLGFVPVRQNTRD